MAGGNKVNKHEIVDFISKKVGISNHQSEQVVNGIIEVITVSLSKGEVVKIPEFGVFKTVKRNERKERNPQSGSELIIPLTIIPQFKAAEFLKNKVNQIDFLQSMVTKGKVTIEEAKVLKSVVDHSKELKRKHKDEETLLFVDVEQIAKDCNIKLQEAERISNTLIKKRILNTMVYYGATDSVYLRANYKKYL